MDLLFSVVGAIVVIGVLVLMVRYLFGRNAAWRELHPKVGKVKQTKEEIQEQRLRKTIKDTRAKLAQMKKVVKPVEVPPPVPPPSKPGAMETQGTINSLAEFPIGSKIGIEMTRIKDDESGRQQRVVVSKGMVKIKTGGFSKDPRKLLFFVLPQGAYYINPKKIIKVTGTKKGKEIISYKLAYDVLYGEALNQDGSIDWDEELEMILADSGMDQYVTIAAFEGGFQLTPTIKKVMLIIGFLGFLGGLAVNGSAHVVPTVIIHWIPVGK